MKNGRLFFVLLIAVAVFGCKSPPPPPPPPPPKPPSRIVPVVALTPVILERLRNMNDFKGIEYYQFVLSDDFTLSLENNNRNDRSKFEEGLAIFDNARISRKITFQNERPGQVLDVKTVGDRIVLRVYFEEKGDEANHPANIYYLTFSARQSEQNAYFYLDYNAPLSDMLGEEKGTLNYGPETYTLRFNDEERWPYLLLKLERKTTPTTDEDRNIKGRLVP